MARGDPIQDDFSLGEISPFVKGRAAADAYKKGVDFLKNYLPIPQGPLTRRTGTKFVASSINDDHALLVPFVISETDAYMLEFSNNNIRIYKDRAPVTGPIDVVTTIGINEVFDLKFARQGDHLFMVHPNHYPQILVRQTDTVWIFQTIANVPGGVSSPHIDGPYFNVNTFDDGSVSVPPFVFTLVPSGTTGLITITGGSSFAADWAPIGATPGRLIRLNDSAGNWTYVRTETFVNAGEITANIIGPDLPNLTGINTFQFGAYYRGTGFPASIAFHQNRLVLGGLPLFPGRIDFSKTGEFNKFQPTKIDGTVADDLAISIEINSGKANRINWLESDENGLLVGTQGAEWIITGSLGKTLLPSNISAEPYSSYGNADEDIIRVGRSLLSLGLTRTKFREIKFVDNSGGFTVRDIGLLADHLLRPLSEGVFSLLRDGRVSQSGVSSVPALQPDPYARLWIALSNGDLISVLTSEQDDVGFGPTRIELGGLTVDGGPARVVSVATLPSPDGTTTDVWLLVNRFIDGNEVNYIEIITQEFDERIPLAEGLFLDSSVTQDTPIHISAITQANPPVVTTTFVHGLLTGETVKLQKIQGMTELNAIDDPTITFISPTSFSLNGVDSTLFAAFIAGGSATVGDVNLVREKQATVTGLGHLEGEEVGVLGDGKVQKNKVVVAGVINLDSPAAIAQVGYLYKSQVRLSRFDSGSATGSSFLKTQRIDRVNIMFDRSVQVKIGKDFSDLELFQIRPDAVDEFTGVKSENITMDYDLEVGNKLCIQQDDPLPGTILAVMPKLTTQDR